MASSPDIQGAIQHKCFIHEVSVNVYDRIQLRSSGLNPREGQRIYTTIEYSYGVLAIVFHTLFINFNLVLWLLSVMWLTQH